MLGKLLTRLATVCVLLVLGALAGTAPASGAPQLDHKLASAAKFKPRILASKKIRASVGGTVRASNGVQIIVPAKVMRHNALVWIKEVEPSVFDVHINTSWKGKVQVRMPLTSGQPVVIHKVNGKWRFESAKRVGNLAQASVSSLSLFSTIVECLAKLRPNPGAALNTLLCFARYGLVKVLPKWVLQKTFGIFVQYDACKPISFSNFTLDPIEALTSACALTETPPPPPAPTPTPTPPPPPPSGPVEGFTIGDVYLGGTWARTDYGDGTWYAHGNRPGNAAYWYPNGLGVAVDCAVDGASYTVHFRDGHQEVWTTWFHVTDGKWMPSAAAQETVNNSYYGLSRC